ncbi:carbohydrate sulfotransferase 11-like [Mytilus californianus]|uniref:carbohydrate sulfotransferase 11-like n=1 Tax=Mytilus californianus TaxID=6549 RepID=UPI0022483BCA|nr:carbohydrate sulfotransferase 11-like [Mytilus californianus]XP_052071955.1 carbohydrate sulfotransferase 11-like [Mytilus californianus]XP_052071956.1 carbohydrate sulfotransferase 11-like [Mytilus californianus]
MRLYVIKRYVFFLFLMTTIILISLGLHGNIVTQQNSWTGTGDMLIRHTDEKIQEDPNLKIFKDRRNTMIDACSSNETSYTAKNTEGTLRNHFVIDRKHKFIYCAMEKIGSTFWRRLFQIISGSSKKTSPFDIPPGAALGGHQETFKTLSFDDIHSVLSSSKKFIIVRDPYARLYSGYMDKLFSANLMFWESIGKFGVETFRDKPSNISKKCGHDLTFTEFIKYFIHSETHNKRRDGHFLPMYDHCRPCEIKYDIIAKMESMSKDTLSVLEILNMTELHDTLEKQFTEDTREDSFIDQTKILFGSFAKTKNCLSIYENQKRMWTKFKSRGLISKYAEFPFHESESESLTKEKYIKALKQAVKESKDNAKSKQYRNDYLQEAFMSVPKDVLRRLHVILRTDCQIFGYDCDSHLWIENAFH